MGPGLQRRLHHCRPARVAADRRAHGRQAPDRRDDALELVAFPHRGGTRASQFPADVDDRRARFQHGGGMGAGDLGSSEEGAAIGKAIGRDVEHADDLPAGRGGWCVRAPQASGRCCPLSQGLPTGSALPRADATYICSCAAAKRSREMTLPYGGDQLAKRLA